MSLYDGVDIDGVPMQSNSTEGTDITKLCELIYIPINIFCISVMSWEENLCISKHLYEHKVAKVRQLVTTLKFKRLPSERFYKNCIGYLLYDL